MLNFTKFMEDKIRKLKICATDEIVHLRFLFKIYLKQLLPVYTLCTNAKINRLS